MTRWLTRSALVLLLAGSPAMAADHLDGPAVTSNPDADLTDLYAWMDPGGKLNIALDWFPDVPAGADLSDAVLFVVHVNSKQSFDATESTETNIICGFNADQTIQCWAGDSEYVTGDASVAGGITSDSGNLRVFAGDRNDPFFFNFEGFMATVDSVKAAAPSLTFDPAGCPEVDAATSAALVEQLQSAPDGSAPQDFFADKNVQTIIYQVDLSVVNAGGPILSIWGSTHQR